MFTKAFRTPVALAFAACAITLPAQALAASPSEKTAGLWQDPAVILSEKLAGLAPDPQTDAPAPIIVSEKLAGLAPAPQADAPAPVIVSEKLAGLTSEPLAVTHAVAEAGEFEWADAGVGAAATLAFVLVIGCASVVVRQQRRRIAAR